MKKYFLLLLIFAASLQLEAQTTLANKLKITGNTTSITAPFVNVQEIDGLVNKISKGDLIDAIFVDTASQLTTEIGNTSKLYVTRDNNIIYRYNGTIYISLSADISGKENISNKGIANGYASLDSSGKVPLIQINDALLGAVNYKGTYDAANNTPALPLVASENKGHYYIVSTAGTQVGLTLNIGDWIISNGVSWGKVDNNNSVTSVNGRTGAVVVDKTDVLLSNVDNTSDANKPVSTATQTALNLKFNTPTGLTTNYLPKWNGTSFVNSKAFETSNTFSVGTNTNIDFFTRFYIFGGTNGANLDVRPGGGGYDQAIVDLQSSDYSTTSSSVHLKYQGPGAIGTLDGFPSTNLADLTYSYLPGDRAFLIRSLGLSPIVFTVDGVERGRFGTNGLTATSFIKSGATSTNILLAGGTDITQASLPVSTATQTALDLKANLASPTFTGTPTAPTATVGTNTAQIATTAFVLANANNIPQLESNATDLTVWNNGKGNISTNTSFGDGALKVNSTGQNNTSIGFNALSTNTTQSGNTAVGVNSGSLAANGVSNANTTNSVYLGKDTRAGIGGGFDNEIVIGANAVGLGTNTAIIGTTSTAFTRLHGQVQTAGSFVKTSATSTNILLAGGTDITQASLPVSTATQTALDGKLNLTGGTLSGALNGTSANFSSSVTAQDLILSKPVVPFVDTYTFLKMDSANYGYNIKAGLQQDVGSKFAIERNNLGAITEAFSLNSAMQATFASSVTASGNIEGADIVTVKGSSPFFRFNNASGTRLAYIQHNGTGLAISSDVGNISIDKPTTFASSVTAGGNLKAVIPIYASDATADADTALLSGQLYKLTGSRVVYQKP
jgi:hypothetical protein